MAFCSLMSLIIINKLLLGRRGAGGGGGDVTPQVRQLLYHQGQFSGEVAAVIKPPSGRYTGLVNDNWVKH